MDFGALPPEINSARMYAGAGAAPLMAAAASWNAIAVELSTTAASFESIITQLVTEQWMGPASLSMAAAAQPFSAWLAYTAESTALAGSQATASAAAFEAAFVMTVPPAVVAANRVQLAALVATNILGQNTPAIAATEVEYAEMWVQDALAMYGYAAASAAAGRLNPLTPPAQIANPSGMANQAATVGQAAVSNSVQQVGLGNLVSNVPNAVMGFAAPVASTAEATALDAVAEQITALLETPFVMNTVNGVVNTGGWFAMAGITSAVFLGHALDTAAPAAGAIPGVVGAAALANTVAPAFAGPVLAGAGLGQAATVGALSVPASWSSAAPALTAGTTALEGTGWAVPQESGTVVAMPGAPGVVGGRDAFAGPPRYGFKPIVMPKQVVV